MFRYNSSFVTIGRRLLRGSGPYRWPAGGPPEELLGPSDQRVEYRAETVRLI